MPKVYYACYGSNLNSERFKFYLQGGNLNGREYAGSRDKSKPEKEFFKSFQGKLVFKGRSQSWNNGAIAFIDKERDLKFYSKLYLLNDIQFIDIWLQENGLNPFHFNSEKLIKQFQKLSNSKTEFTLTQLLENKDNYPYYGQLFKIDEVDNYSVYTFTAPDLSLITDSKVASSYSKTIFQGLRENNNISEEEAINYLYRCFADSDLSYEKFKKVLKND